MSTSGYGRPMQRIRKCYKPRRQRPISDPSELPCPSCKFNTLFSYSIDYTVVSMVLVEKKGKKRESAKTQARGRRLPKSLEALTLHPGQLVSPFNALLIYKLTEASSQLQSGEKWTSTKPSRSVREQSYVGVSEHAPSVVANNVGDGATLQAVERAHSVVGSERTCTPAL